jgi:hypothetical protein
VNVSTSGLEFDDVVQKLSGPLRQRLVERLADIAWASAFWNAPRKTLGKTQQKSRNIIWALHEISNFA